MIISSLAALALLFGPAGDIKMALAAVRHPEIRAVVECESGTEQWNPDGTIITGKAGELGIGQFKPTTWASMNKLRGTDLDIYNPLDQINMIDWAFDQGYQNQWTCYRLIHNG